MRPRLFTSIPPARPGVPPAARRRQLAAIRSWHDSGFDPVSVNSAAECARHPELSGLLRTLGVTAVALPNSDVPGGRHRCRIADVLQAARDLAGAAPFVVVNADILLAPESQGRFAAMVAELAVGHHFVAQRTDVATGSPGPSKGQAWAHGLDLFALHGADVERVLPLLSSDLMFGQPWWDHYLPLSLLATGSHAHLVEPSWCLHEVHATQWSWRQYRTIGLSAWERFRTTALGLPDSPFARVWLDATEHDLLPRWIPRRVGSELFRVCLRHTELSGYPLRRIASANMALVLQAARPLALGVGSVHL